MLLQAYLTSAAVAVAADGMVLLYLRFEVAKSVAIHLRSVETFVARNATATHSLGYNNPSCALFSQAYQLLTEPHLAH